jgi:hypothetical protein
VSEFNLKTFAELVNGCETIRDLVLSAASMQRDGEGGQYMGGSPRHCEAANRGLIESVEAKHNGGLSWGEACLNTARLCGGFGAVVSVSGIRGTGKTQAATVCSLIACMLGGTCYHITGFSMLEQIKQGFGDDGLRVSDLTRHDGRLGQIDLLTIDECDKAFSTDWGLGILSEVVDGRYCAGLPTILVSNLEPSEFKERFGRHIARRINEAGGWVEFMEPIPGGGADGKGVKHYG